MTAAEYQTHVDYATRRTLALGSIFAAIFMCGVGVVVGLPWLLMHHIDLFYAGLIVLIGGGCMVAGSLLIAGVEYSRQVAPGCMGLVFVCAGAFLAIASILYIGIVTSDDSRRQIDREIAPIDYERTDELRRSV